MITDTLIDAVSAAMREAASRAILPRFGHLAASEVNAKAAGDLVTIADHESEAILAERLGALLPEAAIVGEEAVAKDATLTQGFAAPLCWIIDPLDGTNNFAAGRRPFGVLVALAAYGEAVAGWIFDPISGRLCHASAGGGAFVDGVRVHARPTGETPPVAGISLLFASPPRRALLREHIVPHYRLADIPRCAAEQYPRLVLGTNDLAVFERTLAWDHAAGALFLTEAGGKAARLDGTAYRVDDDRRGLIAAASPALWEGLATLMRALPQ